MSNQGTPHIKASPADFAKTVLMPGDPLRSKFVAETFLENPKLVNNVRGVQGYTGMYKNKRENAVIFTLSCNNPQQSCFCKVFDIDASNPKGDVECHLVNGYMYFDAKTQKAKIY